MAPGVLSVSVPVVVVVFNQRFVIVQHLNHVAGVIGWVATVFGAETAIVAKIGVLFS